VPKRTLHFSDGYKSEADKAEVEKVRTLIRSVEGFKAVHIIENPHNLGLAKTSSEALPKLSTNTEK